MEAKYYHFLDEGQIRCDLCPRNCVIPPETVGFCHVRRNIGGKLVAETYRRPAALQIDPIEKKPLSCYRPGTLTFSVGTYGCNLGCKFCQNDHLARHGLDEALDLPEVPPEKIVELARKYGCESVALTYNEPTVFFEYAMEIVTAAREAGLGTVLVSNGYINPVPRRELYPLIEAANIDIKGDADFYRDYCSGHPEPVWESCRIFKKEYGGHLELTNLLIPGGNDTDHQIAALLDRIAEQLGADTPIHFSAYHPAGGFHAPPTPPPTLYRARDLARERGFSRIQLGNL